MPLQAFYLRHALLAAIGVALLVYLYHPYIRRCCGRDIHAPQHVWRLFHSVAVGLGLEVGLLPLF